MQTNLLGLEVKFRVNGSSDFDPKYERGEICGLDKDGWFLIRKNWRSKTNFVLHRTPWHYITEIEGD